MPNMPTKAPSKPLVIDSMVRVSRLNGRGADDRMTDRTQTRANARTIAEQGYAVGEHVEALNVSGSIVADGPAWQRALERVRSGQSAGMAFAYSDRLARDVISGVGFMDDVIAEGGVILFPGRKLDKHMTDSERFAFIVEMAAHELQVRTYKKRSIDTRNNLRERGVVASMSYGFMRNRQEDGTLVDPTRDAKALVLHPEEAPIVRTVFSMRAAGESWETIRKHLEAAGIPTPTGGKVWPQSTLSGLVVRVVYRGDMTSGDETFRDTHPAIVSREVWEKAQPTKIVRKGRTTTLGVAAKIMRCDSCGRPLGLNPHKGGASYQCRRITSAGRCQAPASGHQGKIDAAIDARLREVADGQVYVQSVSAARVVEEAEAALALAEADMDAFLEGTDGLSGAVIRKHMERHTERVDAARDALALAQEETVRSSSFPTSAAAWDDLSPEAKREAATYVIREVRLARFDRASGVSSRFADPTERLTIHWV